MYLNSSKGYKKWIKFWYSVCSKKQTSNNVDRIVSDDVIVRDKGIQTFKEILCKRKEILNINFIN